jgi:hypothetical protein
MTTRLSSALRPRPMIAVTDVEASSRWYQQVLADGTAGAAIETDVHMHPDAGHRENWLRDPDGYLVVLAEPYL